MAFLYFFDELNFDEKGEVCETKTVDKNNARSNFLYLICKYNQELLNEKNEPIPEFFKTGLNKLLDEVENGKNYEKNKKQILSECIPEVQACANSSDRAMILQLNEFVSVSDKELSKKFENDLHRNYVQTHISGRLFDEIERAKKTMMIKPEKKVKSEIFKKMIKYNRLASAMDNMKTYEKDLAS